MSEERITIDDVIAAGFCPRGIRRWCVEKGIDFRDFKDNGIGADVLIASGDGRALKVIQRKQARDHGR